MGTVTGDFSEDVTAGSVNLAAHIGIGWIPIPVNVNVPITYMPGFKKGAFEVNVLNKTKSEVGGSAMSLVDLYGTVKGNDGNGGAFLCKIGCACYSWHGGGLKCSSDDRHGVRLTFPTFWPVMIIA